MGSILTAAEIEAEVWKQIPFDPREKSCMITYHQKRYERNELRKQLQYEQSKRATEAASVTTEHSTHSAAAKEEPAAGARVNASAEHEQADRAGQRRNE